MFNTVLNSVAMLTPASITCLQKTKSTNIRQSNISIFLAVKIFSVKLSQGQNINLHVSGKCSILEWARHTSGSKRVTAKTGAGAKKQGLALRPKKRPQSRALLAGNPAATVPSTVKYQHCKFRGHFDNFAYICIFLLLCIFASIFVFCGHSLRSWIKLGTTSKTRVTELVR